jgi:hypothetical protein
MQDKTHVIGGKKKKGPDDPEKSPPTSTTSKRAAWQKQKICMPLPVFVLLAGIEA